MAETLDIAAEYSAYLTRFEESFGGKDVGSFVKHDGRLVKKLSRDEFGVVYGEYYANASRLFSGMDKGATIDDAMVKVIRDRARELFLVSPI